MASTPQVYKTLGQNDKVGSKTLLHEQIPITGTITGNKLNTYGTFPSESNIKYFNAGTHIDVYDYPYASSSANFMFSMTAGYAAAASPAANTQASLKNNIYRQFSQQYVGYDTNQEPVEFNASGVLNPANTFPPKFDGAVFIDFSRVLMKDEIKKGSFTIEIGTGSFSYPFADNDGSNIKTFSDAHVNANDASTYKTNSPMGDYALLQEGTTSTVPSSTQNGFLFYQAGLLVLAANNQTFGTELTSGSIGPGTADSSGAREAQGPNAAILSGSINDFVNGVRHHINNIQFNNTTELNSTIYFCRANNNEFNYSSNPSFTSGGQITVKNNPDDPSVTYVTSVGLYSADNQLLAVGKLSEPIKKTSSTEFTLRVRLDY